MAFELPVLPYDKKALEPHMSARTFEFHHGKHHQTYVNNLNGLIEGSDFEAMPLEEIVRQTAGKADKTGMFNNAAQTWNHTFFWNCMKPGGGGKPSGDLAKRIDSAFGSYEDFASAFKSAATGRFGSGWAWLVSDDGTLKVTSTPNAETPLSTKLVPLLTVDVWEHAYYLDYQNARPVFVDAFLNHLVNWDFAARNLG